ncbi:MAG: EAL domain-containing protein [Gammaproteobacteria bacterium]|nr:EAL domain-containing protein [Gammaproteobacteria bacterium]
MALSFFSSPVKLSALMSGAARRLVILAETDVEPRSVQTLCNAIGRTPFGVIVASNRRGLRSSNQAALVNKLGTFDNIEWLGETFGFDTLSAAARRCRRRMLTVSKQGLERAFSNNEFLLRYQPKVERSSPTQWLARETEALIRWNSPQYGLLSPLEFLPEIEAFDLMGELGEHVLREAARQLVSWQEKGIQLNSCVNLASSRLGDRNLATRYTEIVKAAGLECSRFTFEIVEQDLHDNDAPHVKTLHKLREAGFRICLDDFRIAAALGTLDHLPLDEIKIHGSVLKRAQDDRVAMTVLAAVTGRAHNLGMSVSADGVEDEATFELLKTINCDKLQGFLISEAVLPSIIQQFYAAGEDGEEEVA